MEQKQKLVPPLEATNATEYNQATKEVVLAVDDMKPKCKEMIQPLATFTFSHLVMSKWPDKGGLSAAAQKAWATMQG